MIAKVIVDLRNQNVNRLFDYIIPEKYINNIEKGMRVIVSFNEQTRLAYVIDIVDKSEYANKEIIEVLDIIPSINEEIFEYIEYLDSINYGLFIDILKTVLPNEIFLDYKEEIRVLDKDLLPLELRKLFNNREVIAVSNKLKDFKSTLRTLHRKKVLSISRVYKKRANKKYSTYFSYNETNTYKTNESQKEIIEYIKNKSKVSKKELLEKGFTKGRIDTLVKNNCLVSFNVEEKREVNFIKTDKIPFHELTPEQKNAINIIDNNLNKSKVILLNGVTSSGKTEVYMNTMENVLKNDKKVLYLVPELAMIAPLMKQLNSRFNETITHYNSSLSAGERFDSYNKILENETNIIVGTRSAIFLPIENLGLIVIDEEHDSLYQQDEPIYYDTLDIAKIKSKIHNALILLGSATPRVTTMYNAINQEYELIEIHNRPNSIAAPKITFVDMKKELAAGNTKIFSKVLKEKINDRLEKKEQTVLLYNRKGYSSFMMCRTCGYTPKCKNCDISLTYYKEENELRCSYCGYKEENKELCPSCGKKTIRPIGLGIDQVFELTKKEFKNAKVLVIDSKKTTKKGEMEKLWLDFYNHEYDILIGTKMITKGLDFPKVTLSGILMADLELKSPTYLSNEEAYKTITQMIGRSGRMIVGEAVVQGYDLENYAIKAVKESYSNFYSNAIYSRKITKYLPFYNVKQILVSNISYFQAFKDAKIIADKLKRKYEIVLGPTEANTKYIKNEYRFLLTIKDLKINDKEIINVIKEKYESKVKYVNNPNLI